MAQATGVDMFTGIVGEMGTIRALERIGGGVRLAIQAPKCSAELNVNDSIAVNGVCQTVVWKEQDLFRVESVEETVRKTTLGDLSIGARVNLELPVRLNDRLGGHLVMGHVDCVGVIREIEPQVSSELIHVAFPHEFGRYLIPVGSIAIDGISLTVARLEGDTFTVSIIPHTFEHTTLGSARRGKRVNLEFDLVGKYIERLLEAGHGRGGAGGITPEKLTEWGIST
jgi:riboflavin synthase